MANHVPVPGRVVGQRCATCSGAVKWVMGGRPSHVYAQDFADFDGATHPALLEAGEPLHYWVAGTNGAPDVSWPATEPMDVALAATADASALWNALHATDVVQTSTWSMPDMDPMECQGSVDTPVVEREVTT